LRAVDGHEILVGSHHRWVGRLLVALGLFFTLFVSEAVGSELLRLVLRPAPPSCTAGFLIFSVACTVAFEASISGMHAWLGWLVIKLLEELGRLGWVVDDVVVDVVVVDDVSNSARLLLQTTIAFGKTSVICGIIHRIFRPLVTILVVFAFL